MCTVKPLIRGYSDERTLSDLISFIAGLQDTSLSHSTYSEMYPKEIFTIQECPHATENVP